MILSHLIHCSIPDEVWVRPWQAGDCARVLQQHLMQGMHWNSARAIASMHRLPSCLSQLLLDALYLKKWMGQGGQDSPSHSNTSGAVPSERVEDMHPKFYQKNL